VEFFYKVDNFYSPECDRSIRFDDPSIGVDWGAGAPVLSAKDQNAPLLEDGDCNFTYTA
jgi:dTDP-4-dehydrorhamnose 3,5-epimerase